MITPLPNSAVPHVTPLSGRQIRHILVDLDYLPLLPTEKSGHHWHYAWRFDPPDALRQLANKDPWNDPFNPWVLGALYQFESVHQLPIVHGSDGILGLPASINRALRKAKRPDPIPWTWVLVSKFPRPETLRIFVAARGWVYQSLCNTGVLKATPDGTWPIYARATHTRMVGVFPIPVSRQRVRLYQAAVAADLSVPPDPYHRFHHHWVTYQHYNDPDIRWVNYFYRGRAVHFYPRASYGYPQSAGCVELPKAAARQVFGLLHTGVPVSIVHQASNLKPVTPTPPGQPNAPRWVYKEMPQHSNPMSVRLQLVMVGAVAPSPAPGGTAKPKLQPRPDKVLAESVDPSPAA